MNSTFGLFICQSNDSALFCEMDVLEGRGFRGYMVTCWLHLIGREGGEAGLGRREGLRNRWLVADFKGSGKMIQTLDISAVLHNQ